MGFILLLGAALAAPAPEDPAVARLASSLRQVVVAGEAERLRWAELRGDRVDARGGPVVLEMSRAGVDPAVLLSVDTEIRIEVVRARSMQVWIPHDRLLDVAGLDGVLRVREPVWARPKTVTSEGVAPLFENVDWHAQEVVGAGVVVGIVDVGFAGWRDLKGVELPLDVDADEIGDGEAGHGTAVAEIVHDVAPEASLKFFEFQTDQEFMAVMEQIVEEGVVDVLNASIGFDNLWTLDGSSPYSQMVDYAVAQGVVYVAAAGNEADKYSSGAIEESEVEGELLLNGLAVVKVRAPSRQVEVSFRWSDPMGASSNDIDIQVVDENGEFCGESTDPQDGDDNPYERVVCELPEDRGFAWVRIVEGDGAVAADLTGWLYSPSGVADADQVPEGTLTLPSDAAGAITIGGYKLASKEVAFYSSRGPTEDGRLKPELVAAVGVSTESLGPRLGEGSSYSAPHAAGAAALLLSADGRLTPPEIREYLVDWALDIEDEGPDNTSGHGVLSMGEIPRGCGCRTDGRLQGGLEWGAVALLLGLRRTRR